MVDISDKNTSVRRQCKLLEVCRSKLFYNPKMQLKDEGVLPKIKEIWEECPFYGYRKITHELRRRGYNVNLKRIQRIMNAYRIFSITTKKCRKSAKSKGIKYPFLLKDVIIQRVNQVWSTDITYIRLNGGFIYLAAIIDVFSRMIVGFSVSTTMDTDLCLAGLNMALEKYGPPELINTDQGTQFTSNIWIEAINALKINISMDGKGRWVDNVYIERAWRTIKQENVFIMDYQSVKHAKVEICRFINFYNFKRLHQNLGYKTPSEVYNDGCAVEHFVYAKRSDRKTQMPLKVV